MTITAFKFTAANILEIDEKQKLSDTESQWAFKITSTPPYAFMAWCSVKAQRQFYLYLL
jgi:hypothetical protein